MWQCKSNAAGLCREIANTLMLLPLAVIEEWMSDTRTVMNMIEVGNPLLCHFHQLKK
jgi:hypothetical protein